VAGSRTTASAPAFFPLPFFPTAVEFPAKEVSFARNSSLGNLPSVAGSARTTASPFPFLAAFPVAVAFPAMKGQWCTKLECGN